MIRRERGLHARDFVKALLSQDTYGESLLLNTLPARYYRLGDKTVPFGIIFKEYEM